MKDLTEFLHEMKDLSEFLWALISQVEKAMIGVITGRALAAPLCTSDFVSNKALCFLVCCFCKHTMGKSFSQLHIFIK
jgi:hypothetical protein